MISQEQILLRLVLATILGGLVGWERGRMERAAGLRTHSLVCIGASLFMLVSTYGFDEVRQLPGVMLDPSRVAAQVVSGIGFLGAGTIILQRQVVKGLTTAASIWSVAAVGLAVGGGMFIAAGGGTILLLLILAGAKPIERRLHIQRPVLTMVVDRQVTSLFVLVSTIEKTGAYLERIVILPGATPDEDTVQVNLRHARGAVLVSVVEQLRGVPGVQEISTALGRPRPAYRSQSENFDGDDPEDIETP